MIVNIGADAEAIIDASAAIGIVRKVPLELPIRLWLTILGSALRVTILMTPPIAEWPHKLTPPRTTSTRSIVSFGTMFHCVVPKKGSFMECHLLKPMYEAHPGLHAGKVACRMLSETIQNGMLIPGTVRRMSSVPSRCVLDILPGHRGAYRRLASDRSVRVAETTIGSAITSSNSCDGWGTASSWACAPVMVADNPLMITRKITMISFI